MASAFRFVAAFFLGVASLPAVAQTLPSGVINAPPTVIGDNESIGSNTTLNVLTGGVVGDNFRAGLVDGTSSDVLVNVYGGTVGEGFAVYGGAVLNIAGGEVGPTTSFGSTTVSGGHVAELFAAARVTGGEIESFGLNSGVTEISGGVIASLYTGPFATLREPPIVNISGGRVDAIRRFATFTSETHFFGRHFAIDGNPIDGLVRGEAIPIDAESGIFTGVLVDGTPFSYDLFDAAASTPGPRFQTLTVTLVPEPTSLVLAALCWAMAFRRPRSRVI